MMNMNNPMCHDMMLVDDLVKAINGEYTAIECYGQLIKNAPSSEERERITEIREDEMRHFQTFSRIYTTLTGMQPSPQMTSRCPSKYCEGLEAAFEDEQKTVDFYHRVAEKTMEPMIKAAFHGAAADEQNHAVWFLYLMSKHHHKKD